MAALDHYSPRSLAAPAALVLLATVLSLACSRPAACDRCGTIVFAATGEPSSLLPPLVQETVGRDIGDQIFERLADLSAGGAPIDVSAYRPRLAVRWEPVDSLTWRFHLRPGARWSDGKPVTAEDVRFSFDAFADSAIDAAARAYVEGLKVTAQDSATVLIHFKHWYPEELYDATYHVRILPEHVWGPIPRNQWAADTIVGHLIGSGPFRLARWVRGQSVTLESDSTAAAKPASHRLVWRFSPDPDAALNLVLGHEADLLESVGTPDRVERIRTDSTLTAMPYPSAAYGFLGFRIGNAGAKAVSPVASRAVRRALVMATDRPGIARAMFGPETKAPPGPMSQLLWIWDDRTAVLPYDTVAAARELDAAGWKTAADGSRTRMGHPLALDILVPATSPTRKRIAEILQERWRRLGIKVTVTGVDFPVFQQRLAKGQFDSYIGAYLDEPSPRGLADQWTRAGWGALNFGRYENKTFDSLFARAEATAEPAAAHAAWREALDTLNSDPPAIFLYAPTNVAAVSRRLGGVRIDPYSWASGATGWSAGAEGSTGPHP
ncbi:MAG: peptide ABC transporter substrate-binding protein [Gemmatimonadota bacterium]